MGNTTNSANMNMPVPIPGVQIGPQWATNINACLAILDGHDHSNGKGVLITPAGLSITSDLPMGGNSLLNIKALFLASQASVLAASNAACLYNVLGNLYFNSGSGEPVQITNGTALAGTPGSISGMTSGVTVSYQGLSKTFVFQSAAATAASLDVGSIIVRNLTVSANGITLQAPLALGANYSLTLPQIPAVTGVLTVDTSGNIVGTTPATSLVPAGVMSAFAGAAAPSGYLLCDGASYLRTGYPALFAAIGTAWGTADSTHFNVPDMRGRFARGRDGGVGNDTDAATRTALLPGGATGDNVGSYEEDAFQLHEHHVPDAQPTGFMYQIGGVGPVFWCNQPPPQYDTAYVVNEPGHQAARTSEESRPKNVNINYIIKI